MYAFALIHFGNNFAYLELELYFLLMLKKNTVHDILYLYSVQDTPSSYLQSIQSLAISNLHIIPYEDQFIMEYISTFVSSYTHFNTLRTCNYIFSYRLIQYQKICIIESDMVILSTIDSIFTLNCPAILYYGDNPITSSLENVRKNHILEFSRSSLLQQCKEKSFVNGGILLLKPSMSRFKSFVKNIPLIVKHNCKYPNETLFLYTEKKIYNMPIIYNYSHYYFHTPKYKPIQKEVMIYHYNSTLYKPLHIIKDHYLSKIKDPISQKVIMKYKKYYDQFQTKIKAILLDLNKQLY